MWNRKRQPSDRAPWYRPLNLKKSRVESGAKAPHSMECGDLLWSAAIYRRFAVKALAFTNLGVDAALPRPREAVHR